MGQANVLAPLYKRVLVPTAVVEEMLQPATPDAVRVGSLGRQFGSRCGRTRHPMLLCLSSIAVKARRSASRFHFMQSAS